MARLGVTGPQNGQTDGPMVFTILLVSAEKYGSLVGGLTYFFWFLETGS